MKDLQLKFYVDDRVTIKDLEIKGVVVSISITRIGVQYEVRYFWNAEAKFVFFLEDELQ